ncbi:GNAT family N-acetyltransferase [Arthrobacter mobilis]|uniref:GNAT family N-acetyltransferase n=1 Tax=Arthrobacter mobilis TaxID=2724944 RepID=A0A7X6HAY4_9MICC|nr:GNAT family protein [Arthrobacter mobilis]NKX53024.1 GNAT family N-acetyltransferase [Arthrobacter mobilis]
MTTTNAYGQPLGDPVPDWAPAGLPDAVTVPGRYCTLELLDPDRHAEDLYAAYAAAPDARDWTYLPVGPFPTPRSYRDWAIAAAKTRDPRHYAVIDNATGRALGTLSLMRHDPANGVIEVGYVVFSRALQRTPASTEAQFLLMRYAFDDLGYRRYEWKCDSLNEPSRKAAERLGFTYEGTFRQVVVYKGRNRDTAWYALTDHDWPPVRDAFEKWLDPANFDTDGRQRDPLRTR